MKTCLIVTSISPPNLVLKALAEGAADHSTDFILIGDSKSPQDFALDGVDYYPLERQRGLEFSFAKAAKERSYARKNIGYLIAMSRGAQAIIETDDDNFPRLEFWADRKREVTGSTVESKGWVNVYGHFSSAPIWPRGYPLQALHEPLAPRGVSQTRTCPIQQSLADANPDVDAVYRMVMPLPLDFNIAEPVILGQHSWCPFNSQNTTTFPEAYLLLYLPTFCSFRMTDIWRSFVAQRLLWTCGWQLSFSSATVWQERNAHDLLKDFADEIPGYLHNAEIIKELDSLVLKNGESNLAENLRTCYLKLIDMKLVDQQEMELLDLWIADHASIYGGTKA
ncbi:MAG: STELLO glycosyltransferase family protein [Luteolibacter sp.]